jgi:hypothetical protein
VSPASGLVQKLISVRRKENPITGRLISIVSSELPMKEKRYEIWSLEHPTKIIGTKQNHLA